MPHGFSIGFVLNVTNLVMVLMAKLRYWTNPMRLTVVISTLLFKGGTFEGVVNQQDQKLLDRTVIGKLAGPDKRPRWKWLLCSFLWVKKPDFKTSTSYNVCWIQTMCLIYLISWGCYCSTKKTHWSIKPLHSSWLFTSVMGVLLRYFRWEIPWL